MQRIQIGMYSLLTEVWICSSCSIVSTPDAMGLAEKELVFTAPLVRQEFLL